jgi:hypothetical protein
LINALFVPTNILSKTDKIEFILGGIPIFSASSVFLQAISKEHDQIDLITLFTDQFPFIELYTYHELILNIFYKNKFPNLTLKFNLSENVYIDLLHPQEFKYPTCQLKELVPTGSKYFLQEFGKCTQFLVIPIVINEPIILSLRSKNDDSEDLSVTFKGSDPYFITDMPSQHIIPNNYYMNGSNIKSIFCSYPNSLICKNGMAGHVYYYI